MTEKTQKPKLHHAWKILIAGCTYQMAGMGFIFNCMGEYYDPICEELGWKISQLNFTAIFLGLAACLCMPLVDRIYRKCSVKWVMIISMALYGLSCVMRSAFYTQWQFIAGNILAGIACAFILYIPVPMLINEWFYKYKGMALGISMMSMGIGGAIMNPIINGVIESSGWRTASIFNGIVAFAFTTPFVLLFVVRRPADMGLKPLGYEEMTPADSGSTVDNSESISIAGLSNSEKKRKFILSFAITVMLVIASSMSLQLKSYAVAGGLGATFGAALMSMNMIGNLTFKGLTGTLIDKFGSRMVIGISLILLTGAFLILAFGFGMKIPAVLGAVLCSLSAMQNTMVPPYAVGTFSEGEEYTKNLSRITTGTMLGTAFAIYIPGALYDVFGSYTPVYLIYAAIAVACLILAMMIFSKPRGCSKVSNNI